MTDEGFQDFLKSQPEGRTFKCGSAFYCPLAEYLLHLCSQSPLPQGMKYYVSVTHERHAVWTHQVGADRFASCDGYSNDVWMREVIHRVDQEPIRTDVTVERVLEILEEVRRG